MRREEAWRVDVPLTQDMYAERWRDWRRDASQAPFEVEMESQLFDRLSGEGESVRRR